MMGMNQKNPQILTFLAIFCNFLCISGLPAPEQTKSKPPPPPPPPRNKKEKKPLRLALTLRKSMNNGSERRRGARFFDDVFVWADFESTKNLENERF